MKLLLPIAVGLFILCPGSVLPQSALPLRVSTDVRGAGGWQPDGKVARPSQGWSLDVKRSPDGSLTGRVTLSDSPLMQSGNLKAQILGTLLSGTISDDDGKQVATVQGKLSPSGIDGNYTDRTGETGSWHWEGELPE